jgi:hypothetical protein
VVLEHESSSDASSPAPEYANEQGNPAPELAVHAQTRRVYGLFVDRGYG